MAVCFISKKLTQHFDFLERFFKTQTSESIGWREDFNGVVFLASHFIVRISISRSRQVLRKECCYFES